MAKADKTDETAAEVKAEVKDAAPVAPKADKKDSHEGLVKVSKDGVHLHIHPDTVKAHAVAGWHLA